MPASFVYQKKTTVRDGADVCERKCKRLACAIQVCLSRLPVNKSRVAASTIDHAKCAADVYRYNKCCDAAKAAERDAEGSGDDATPST